MGRGPLLWPWSMAIETTTPSASLQKGTAKRISDVYLSIKVYVAPSALSVREKNQVEPGGLGKDG